MSCQSLNSIYRKMCLIEVESMKSSKLNVTGVTALFKLTSMLHTEFNKTCKIGIPSEYSVPFIHSVQQKSDNLKLDLKDALKEKVKNSYFPEIDSVPEPSVDQLLRENLSFFSLMEALWSFHPNKIESEVILHYVELAFQPFQNLVTRIKETNHPEKEKQLDLCRDMELRAIALERNLCKKIGFVWNY